MYASRVDNGHSGFMNRGGFSAHPGGPKLEEGWEVVSSVARAQGHGGRKQNIVMHFVLHDDQI